jgi:hypothetical protein
MFLHLERAIGQKRQLTPWHQPSTGHLGCSYSSEVAAKAAEQGKAPVGHGSSCA